MEIDSKAMRKGHATDTIVAVLEVRDEVGVATMIGVLNTRLLTKVP